MPITHLPRTVFNAVSSGGVQPLDGVSLQSLHMIERRASNPPPFFGGNAPIEVMSYRGPVLNSDWKTIIAGRLALAYDCLFDIDTVMFCASLCDRPAKAVLWAYGLVRHARAVKHAMDPREWALHLAENEPTDAYMHALWNEQYGFNGAVGNWLDTQQAWSPN